MKKTLIIGDTSQLARYAPSSVDKISSRNIDFDWLKSVKYERVLCCFGEHRHGIATEEDYFRVNLDLHMKVFEALPSTCLIVALGSSEFWMDYSGPICNTTYMSWQSATGGMAYYLESKYQCLAAAPANVIWIHPFNFNSPLRQECFLFGKIFKAMITDTPCVVGSLDFMRELLHPKWVIKRMLEVRRDEVFGNGRPVHVRDFIAALFRKLRGRMYLQPMCKLIREKSGRTERKNVFWAKKEPWDYILPGLVSSTADDILRFTKNL